MKNEFLVRSEYKASVNAAVASLEAANAALNASLMSGNYNIGYVHNLAACIASNCKLIDEMKASLN